jgi:hypothetical protein
MVPLAARSPSRRTRGTSQTKSATVMLGRLSWWPIGCSDDPFAGDPRDGTGDDAVPQDPSCGRSMGGCVSNRGSVSWCTVLLGPSKRCSCLPVLHARHPSRSCPDSCSHPRSRRGATAFNATLLPHQAWPPSGWSNAAAFDPPLVVLCRSPVRDTSRGMERTGGGTKCASRS